MRILDKTYQTEDEGYREESKVGKAVEIWLEDLKLDTYNKLYNISGCCRRTPGEDL